MKALLIGSLFVILLIIAGAVTSMILDSKNTIDAQVVTKTTNEPDAVAAVVKNPEPQEIKQTNSAKDALEDLKVTEVSVPETDESKVGYTLEYQAKQSNCERLIEIKEEEYEDAEEEYRDAKKAYEAALEKAEDLEGTEAIEEAQERITETKDELDDAEKALFNAKEELIKTRTTCVS